MFCVLPCIEISFPPGSHLPAPTGYSHKLGPLPFEEEFEGAPRAGPGRRPARAWSGASFPDGRIIVGAIVVPSSSGLHARRDPPGRVLHLCGSCPGVGAAEDPAVDVCTSRDEELFNKTKSFFLTPLPNTASNFLSLRDRTLPPWTTIAPGFIKTATTPFRTSFVITEFITIRSLSGIFGSFFVSFRSFLSPHPHGILFLQNIFSIFPPVQGHFCT